MARDAEIDRMLVEWAQVQRAGNGAGYPQRSVLHPEWSPPSSGMTPTLVSVPTRSVAGVHWAVSMLSLRLRNTVVVHYCMRGLSVAEQAERLECGERTVNDRIEAAHRKIRALLRERDE